MDFPNTASVTIKTEPAIRNEDQGEIPHTDVVVIPPDIKKETMESADRMEEGKNDIFTKNSNKFSLISFPDICNRPNSKMMVPQSLNIQTYCRVETEIYC